MIRTTYERTYASSTMSQHSGAETKISKSFPLVGGVPLLIDRFITDYPDLHKKAVDTKQRPAERSRAYNITQVEQHWTQAASLKSLLCSIPY